MRYGTFLQGAVLFLSQFEIFFQKKRFFFQLILTLFFGVLSDFRSLRYLYIKILRTTERCVGEVCSGTYFL